MRSSIALTTGEREGRGGRLWAPFGGAPERVLPFVPTGGREPAMSSAAPALGTEAPAWHAIAADEVVQRLDGNTATGLDQAEVSARLATYGPNRLPEAARQGPLRRFLLQFRNVLVYILLGAGLIKAAMGM